MMNHKPSFSDILKQLFWFNTGIESHKHDLKYETSGWKC